MILVDSAVWIKHFRRSDRLLQTLLESNDVRGHPWVTGEIALGSLGNRDEILRLLAELPQAEVATDAELLTMINGAQLHSRGIGYVDAQLLASARLTGDRIWTDDKGLHDCAQQLNIAT